MVHGIPGRRIHPKMNIESLVPKDRFVGLEDFAHLAAGGESPMLKSHHQVFERFMRDKAAGERARTLEAEVMDSARQKSAALFGVEPAHLTFLSSASEGINNVLYGLDWQAGDNIVVADVEFPSGLLPWTLLQDRGVEVRVVRHVDWQIRIEDIASQIDERTRVLEISQVSMFTGQRLDVAALSALARDSNALLLLDATHAAGVVPVPAGLADIVVSSCYKWLLGTHGTALFYVNRERLPDFRPPFLGWDSPAKFGGWKSPLEYTLRPNADAFKPGNPNYLGLYLLDNALDTLLGVGIDAIEAHALALSGRVVDAIRRLGFESMTSPDPASRAGNACFMAPDNERLRLALEKENVYIWGAYAGFGRLRVSTHLYNDSDDVERCIRALESCA